MLGPLALSPQTGMGKLRAFTMFSLNRAHSIGSRACLECGAMHGVPKGAHGSTFVRWLIDGCLRSSARPLTINYYDERRQPGGQQVADAASFNDSQLVW